MEIYNEEKIKREFLDQMGVSSTTTALFWMDDQVFPPVVWYENKPYMYENRGFILMVYANGQYTIANPENWT